MKRTQILLLTAVLVLTVSGLAVAQMDKGKEMMGMGGGMMGKGMMDGKMMGMMGMCSMMHPTIVATSDGGVVILIGNKLTKYDKNLNVVKEVEIKMDMEGMGKMCPMMGKGMMGGEGMADDSSKTDAEKAAEQAEHESHHPENK